MEEITHLDEIGLDIKNLLPALMPEVVPTPGPVLIVFG